MCWCTETCRIRGKKDHMPLVSLAHAHILFAWLPFKVVWARDLAVGSPIPWYSPLDVNRFSLTGFRLTAFGRGITRAMVENASTYPRPDHSPTHLLLLKWIMLAVLFWRSRLWNLFALRRQEARESHHSWRRPPRGLWKVEGETDCYVCACRDTIRYRWICVLIEVASNLFLVAGRRSSHQYTSFWPESLSHVLEKVQGSEFASCTSAVRSRKV